MTTRNTISQRRCIPGAARLLPFLLAAALFGCGGGGGDTTTPPPPPPPSVKTFQVSLEAVVAIDRSDGSVVQVSGNSVSGATATLP